MLRFDSDYMEGCHTDILNNLVEANFEKNTGYGLDIHTMHAKELIKESFDLPNDSLVYLLSGGTITNKTLINSKNTESSLDNTILINIEQSLAGQTPET